MNYHKQLFFLHPMRADHKTASAAYTLPFPHTCFVIFKINRALVCTCLTSIKTLFFFFLYPLPVRDLVGKPGEIEHADIRHVVHIIHHLIDLARVLVHGIKALLHAVRADIDVSRKGNHLSGFALRSAAHEADFFIGIFCMMVRAFCFRLRFVRGTVHSVFLF